MSKEIVKEESRAELIVRFAVDMAKAQSVDDGGKTMLDTVDQYFSQLEGLGMAKALTPGRVVEQFDGPPLVTVRADTLIPMLVYLRKFFRSVEKNKLETPSARVHPEDFEMLVFLKGFTPEDWNALMSLNNTVGTDLAALLDKQVTPQMQRSIPQQRQWRGMQRANHEPSRQEFPAAPEFVDTDFDGEGKGTE